MVPGFALGQYPLIFYTSELIREYSKKAILSPAARRSRTELFFLLAQRTRSSFPLLLRYSTGNRNRRHLLR